MEYNSDTFTVGQVFKDLYMDNSISQHSFEEMFRFMFLKTFLDLNIDLEQYREIKDNTTVNHLEKELFKILKDNKKIKHLKNNAKILDIIKDSS